MIKNKFYPYRSGHSFFKADQERPPMDLFSAIFENQNSDDEEEENDNQATEEKKDENISKPTAQPHSIGSTSVSNPSIARTSAVPLVSIKSQQSDESDSSDSSSVEEIEFSGKVMIEKMLFYFIVCFY